MQHQHFDLKQIEASIREMFASIPAAPADNPVAKLQGQMVEMTVAFECFKFDCANKGLSPDEVYPALLCWMGDRIADLCLGQPDDEARFAAQGQSLDIVAMHLDQINSLTASNGETAGATGCAVINPIMHGNA